MVIGMEQTFESDKVVAEIKQKVGWDAISGEIGGRDGGGWAIEGQWLKRGRFSLC